MGALVSILLPLIPSLIQGVEGIFKDKPKSGPDKIVAVSNALRQIIEQMMAAGLQVGGVPIPEKSVSDDLLRGAIEAVFTKLKATGQLATQPASGDLFIVRGSVVPLGAV